jgi:hypothetical protein
MGTNELKYCTMKKKYVVLDQQEQPRQVKNLLYQQDKPNEPTKEELLSFVLVEPPFISVSTVSRGHPSVLYASNRTQLFMCIEPPLAV